MLNNKSMLPLKQLAQLSAATAVWQVKTQQPKELGALMTIILKHKSSLDKELLKVAQHRDGYNYGWGVKTKSPARKGQAILGLKAWKQAALEILLTEGVALPENAPVWATSLVEKIKRELAEKTANSLKVQAQEALKLPCSLIAGDVEIRWREGNAYDKPAILWRTGQWQQHDFGAKAIYYNSNDVATELLSAINGKPISGSNSRDQDVFEHWVRSGKFQKWLDNLARLAKANRFSVTVNL